MALNVAHRLVYSVHDYPASVASHPWFVANNYPNNLSGIWDSYWGYIYKQHIAPVWVSEFGSKLETNADKTMVHKPHQLPRRGCQRYQLDLLGSGSRLGGYWRHPQQRLDIGQPDQTDAAHSPHVSPGSDNGRSACNDRQYSSNKIPAKTPTAGQSGPVSLQAYYKVGNPGSVTANEIMPQLELFNTGGASINLSDVTIRYWYTLDNQQAQSYWCDYAVVGCNNVNGQFASLSSTRSLVKANAYLQISFNSGAGSIAPGANSGQIQIRFNKNDWSN